MKTKEFDCVEMKRRGAERIYQEVKDLSFEEKVAYWERANQRFLYGKVESQGRIITNSKEKSAG